MDADPGTSDTETGSRYCSLDHGYRFTVVSLLVLGEAETAPSAGTCGLCCENVHSGGCPHLGGCCFLQTHPGALSPAGSCRCKVSVSPAGPALLPLDLRSRTEPGLSAGSPRRGRGQAGGGRAARRVVWGALRKAEAGDALRLCRGRERVKATNRTSLRRGCWPGGLGRGVVGPGGSRLVALLRLGTLLSGAERSGFGWVACGQGSSFLTSTLRVIQGVSS